MFYLLKMMIFLGDITLSKGTLGLRNFSLRLKRMSEVMLKTSAISATSSFERRQARKSFNSFRMVPPNDFSWFLKFIISISYRYIYLKP